MAKTDWFATAEWDPATDTLESFYLRVARCRGAVVFRTRQKARALLKSADPLKRQVGLQIYSDLIERQESDPTNTAALEREGLAKIFFETKQFELAEEHHRKAIAIRTARGTIFDHFNLARALAFSPDPAKRAESEAYFEEAFRRRNWHPASGSMPRSEHWKPYPEFEATIRYDLPLKSVHSHELIDCRLIEVGFGSALDLGEVEVSGANALADFDRLIHKEPLYLGYKFPFVNDELLPELGAYLGNWLVRHRGGRWEKRSPLMASRVRVRDATVNPFLWSHKAIYYSASLMWQVGTYAQPAT